MVWQKTMVHQGDRIAHKNISILEKVNETKSSIALRGVNDSYLIDTAHVRIDDGDCVVLRSGFLLNVAQFESAKVHCVLLSFSPLGHVPRERLRREDEPADGAPSAWLYLF